MKSKYVGKKLLESYSQNKDEVIFGFSDGDKDLYLKAIFNGSFSLVTFPKEPKRARKNSINLYASLIEKTLLDIYVFDNERSFCLKFSEDYSLIFKLHGNRANLVLFENENLISVFKNSLVSDKTIKINDLHRPIDQSKEALFSNDFDLQSTFPTFGKKILEHLNLKNFKEPSNNNIKLEILEDVLVQLKSSKIFIYNKEEVPYISLLEENRDAQYTTSSPIIACNYLASNFISNYYLHREKKEATQSLGKAIKKSSNFIFKSESKLTQIKSSIKNEELANILMANLHLDIKNKTSIELFNFYNNKNVTIKLKKELSLQKNAEVYYRKSKNQQVEIDTLAKNIKVKITIKNKLEVDLLAIQEIQDLNSLRKHLKSTKKTSKSTVDKKTLPYISIEIQGYSVLIGKNAKSNDKLISQFASKNDLWLHARGVSGSHVIIKEKSNLNIPEFVIEKVAEIAAWHSKGKSDTLCPVIYTPRKYIRKLKGGLPGQVIVEKEKVILVKPCRISQ